MEITAAELSSLLEGKVEGDSNVIIRNFAKIEDAGEGDLTFIANPKYIPFVATTKASVILVGPDFQTKEPVKATLIRVNDPYSSIASLMRIVDQMKKRPKGIENPVFIAKDVKISDSNYVGAFSYIGAGSTIGENTLVYPQVYIGENVQIGKNCIIYAGVKIYSDSIIGDGCIIHSGAVIGSDGFGFAPKDGVYEKIPQLGRVIIEDNVEIGANTTIDRATFAETRIGKGTKLDNLIQIAHNVSLGTNNVLAAQTGIAGSTHIGSGNRIGGQVGVAGHIKIGDNNEIGAQSGISGNIGDNRRLIGYPAVDFMQFAKNTVYMKRLDELFKEKRKTTK